MTNSEVRLKLWIIKFCLKVIYPKYNNLLFLAYLAVRYRLLYRKIKSGYNMNKFELKNTSSHIQQLLLKDHESKNKLSFGHQCIIISRRQFIDLASENLFYLDNGALWVNVRLSSNMKKKYKELKNNENKEKLMKYDLKFLTSEVHQKLWGKLSTHSLEKGRILPVIGSKYVQENVALATENEVHNIVSSMGIVSTCDIEITFHPVPSFDCAPQIAAAAEVSLIVNDFDLENDFLKEVLSNHFEVPKLMHVGDIFSIELLPEITTKHHYKYLDLVHSIGKLYFKCRNLDQKQAAGDKDKNQQDQILRKRIGNLDLPYFIVKGVTHLTLGENIHDMKPKDEYLPLQGNIKEMQFLSHCPNGLKQKFDEIQESILPFLSGRLNDFMSCLTSPIIPMFLLTGSTGSGRHLLVKTLAKYNGMNCLQLDCNAIQSSTAKQTESKISATIQKAKAASPVVVLLDNFEVFGVDAENNEDCRVIEFFINSLTELYENYKKHTILFIAVTEKTELKAGVMRIFLEKFHIAKLNLQQRYEMLQWFASAMQLKVDEIDKTPQENEGKTIVLYDTNNLPKSDVLQRVAAKAETFLYGDMDTLVHFAMRESYLKQYNNPTKSLPDPNLHLIHEDEFNSALESMRSLQSQHLDAPKIPKVYWEDIGGLDKLKKELLKTIEFPIKYPHLFKNSSLKRSGILMYGPPGCGKTLVAKAVSTELNVSFLSVKGPELLNMYIGQSEENVRKVFESARAASPCIVFLDELDSLAPRRGAAGDSGGASDRVVSQLLAELDGVSADDDADSSSLVFVMGATNRPDLLEQSLLRPGRLDKLVYVGPYCGPAEKTRVLTALCRKYKLGPEVSLPAVAEALPPRCTGADLLHVVSTARSAAVRALVAALQAGAIKESELSPDSIILGAADFLQGVNTFRPSVTDEDLAYYESLQSQM